MKIENLVEKDTVLDDDYLIVNGTDGTKKAKKSTLFSDLNFRLKRASIDAEFESGAAIIPFSSIGIDAVPNFAIIQAMYLSAGSGAFADSFSIQFTESSINVYGRTGSNQPISGNRRLGILMWFDS